ncbi:acyl-CoA dehydrogenase family protein [Streptomyces sp. NBC_01304]|uniref:acyl-CoA dehydrogenase family protein n=1 Tax=Streptomyces sp. NBC_01304 TaxID=2903818 RepID=UPI002E121AA2|nr:acyl-CoA dehydrogenase family protein [Streptomyces sp. NBC_01304]
MQSQVPVTYGLPHCPHGMREVRDQIAEFVRRRIVPREDVLDRGGSDATAALRTLQGAARQQGLWALPLPVGIGGQGLPLALYAPLAEAEGASDHGPAALGSATLLDALTLQQHGSQRVHDLFLKRLVAGELRMSFAMTEPGTPGTEPRLTEARAERAADGSWRVSGRKWFVGAAAEADLVAVLARTDGTAPDPEGLSLFLVPTDAPGFQLVRELPVLGTGGQWEIELDEVAVDDDFLIGGRGKGLSVAGSRLQLGRTLSCLHWLGQARRAFDLMRERAVHRTRTQGTLGDLQLVQSHVFESLLALRTTRPLVYEAVARLDAGLDAHVEVGLAKVAAARMLQQVTDAAIQVHGAADLGPDTALPSLFRNGRMARIVDGPDELHITSVAGRVLRTDHGV